MKKTLLSLAMLLIGVGAWAQEYDLTEFDVTTNEASPITYVMESRRPAYTHPDWFFDNGKIKMQQHEEYADKGVLEKNNFLFYFTQGSDENKYYIHPYNAKDGYVLGVASAAANQEIIVVNKNDAGTNIAIEWELGELSEGSVTRKYFKTTIGETVYCMQDNGSGNYVKLASDATASFRSTALNFGRCDPSTNEDKLRALIDIASTIESGTVVGTYTAESVTTLQTAITTAEEKLSGIVTEEDIQNLQDAIDALEINLPDPTKFYVIENAMPDEGYATGRKIYVDNSGVMLHEEAENVTLAHVFQFENTGDNTFYLKSVDRGTYLSTAKGNGQGANEAKAYITNAAKIVTIAKIGSENNVFITPNGGTMIHAQNDYSQVVGWQASNDDPGASAWKILEVSLEDVAHNVAIGTTGWASLYLPFNATKPAGATLYMVTEKTEDKATLTELSGDVLPAGVAVLVKAAPSSTLEFKYTTEDGDESEVALNMLNGSALDENVAEEGYVLALQNEVVGFYKATLNQENNTAFKNNAFKAYLLAEGAAGARFLNFDFGTETAIESIQGAENGAVIYDLAGRRVQNAQKGLYIVNGKKVIK